MTIAFNNVSFSYRKNEKPILSQLSFEANKGDRVVFKGSSGSGKTTIFRLIMGFVQPDEGDILVNNEKLTSANIHNFRRKLSWLPQDLNLGDGKTKNVFSLPFEFKANKNKWSSEKAILKTFSALGLPEKAWEEKFKDLSTGQRQRVGIALCHHLQKSVVLLDEPTSALDDISKENVKDLLFGNNEDLIISTSHDPWWIEQCNKVINLDE